MGVWYVVKVKDSSGFQNAPDGPHYRAISEFSCMNNEDEYIERHDSWPEACKQVNLLNQVSEVLEI